MEQNRITMRLKNPNPLFEMWLTEWRDAERAKNSKKQQCFDNALESLRKYPLPLKTGKDCIILQGFGEKLCDMLNRKLHDHSKSVDLDTTIPFVPNVEMQKTKSPEKPYKPIHRSASYAILLTLNNNIEGLTKAEIISLGQHLCDKPIEKVWSAMSILVNKSLVNKQGNPIKFSLTNEGLNVASKLDTENIKLKQNINVLDECVENKKMKITSSGELNAVIKIDECVAKKKKKIGKATSSSSMGSTVNEEPFILSPNLFDVLLLVDTQETAGSKNADEDETINELNRMCVRFEVRHLKIGDYVWICRERGTKNELVLPYIIERKRMDDFGASIKDGRFHEQKFRLKKSGIQNLIYLVESHGSNNHTGLPMNTLHQAATNTLVQDGFQVKFTNDLKATIKYLTSFTNIMDNIYKNKTLISCPKANLVKSSIDDDLISLMTFTDLNQTTAKLKNYKVRELLIKQLLQLKGVSVDKALAIADAYPTPRSLKSAANHPDMLSNLQFGKLRKKIGPVLSKTIYQLYSSDNY